MADKQFKRNGLSPYPPSQLKGNKVVEDKQVEINQQSLKRMILGKAYTAIAIARKQNRIMWDKQGKTLKYISRDKETSIHTIDEMPEYFLTITGQMGNVAMLVGDIKEDLKPFFVTILNTRSDKVDIAELEKKIEADLAELQRQATETPNKEIEVAKQD